MLTMDKKQKMMARTVLSREFEVERQKLYEGFDNISRLGLESDEKLEEMEKKFQEDWAKNAQEQGALPNHEEYVEWKKFRDGKDPKEVAKIKRFVKNYPLYYFREILGLEEDDKKAKFFDEDFVSTLEKNFGSREIAIAYLAGIKHACLYAKNDQEVLENILERPRRSIAKEERIIRSLNSILEEQE